MLTNTNQIPAALSGAAVSRRGFLKAGGAALGALAGSDLFAARTEAAALIQVYLPGGPSHLDTFDPKPNAPAGVRGAFGTVSTSVPGIRFCEHLPALASLAGHLTVVRGLTGLPDEHGAAAFDAGTTAAGRPGLGAELARRWGSPRRTPWGDVPAAVDLSGWAAAGPLGDAFAPRRLGRRQTGVGHFNELCTARHDEEAPADSGVLGRALDLGREPQRTRERYAADAHAENALFLKARRLVEAGVRCVSLAWGYWDTHGDNFRQLRDQLPLLDRGLSALLEDLRADGRLDGVVVVVGGEFGRTPKVNAGGGRDHWPRAATLLVAGGGLPHGRALGSTDRAGAEPADPVRLEDVFGPVRTRLGLAPTVEPRPE